MRRAVAITAIAAVLAIAAAPVVFAAEGPNPIQGVYKGAGTSAGDESIRVEAEVVGEGVPKGQKQPVYRVTLRVFNNEPPTVVEMRGAETDGKVPLSTTYEGIEVKGELSDGKMVLTAEGERGKSTAELKRYVPHSPTEGAKSPEGALVLLGNPASLEEWTNPRWEKSSDTITVKGGDNHSKRQFGDIKQLHVEFKVPYMPNARGQERGNSGVYLNNFYEVQVLDSFGTKGDGGDCGALYSIAPPKVNASFPPETWQTYDITFRAPRIDDSGKMIEAPTITMRHNGVLIHENTPLPRGTERAKPGGESKTGPIRLQDHGYPDQYRNIWVVEK